MANKFTKSVLERQAKEQKLHTLPNSEPVEVASEAAPVPENDGVQAVVTMVTQGVVTTEEATEPSYDVPEPIRTRVRTNKASAINLDAFIVRDEGRTAKNKTFYLDAAVIDALHQAAVSQKITDSKLVNDILRKILGV